MSNKKGNSVTVTPFWLWEDKDLLVKQQQF